MPRDFHLPGRSPVIGCDGMAATSHPLATLAAIETLRAGGNAADAAITAVAALGVVEPQMTGIGGDCFCLVAKPGAPIWGYNGSGRAGARMRVELLQGAATVDRDSIHAVTVPGAVEAWAAILEAHGRFGLDRALAPAIHYAEAGFAAAPRVALDWSREVERLRGDRGAARHFLIDGRAPQPGETLRLPALAKTLRAIAAGGPRAFYRGEIAQDMVETLAARGSVLTAQDFAEHRGEPMTPIATGYRGLEIYELPPNVQGITALVLLNILENFPLCDLDPLGPERFHLMLEAARLAYALRDAHVADPAFMRVAVADLLDKRLGSELAAKIDPERCLAPPSPLPIGGNTVYLTVVDRDRMAVSLINSLFSHFGVAVATAATGIMLHNRGACFSADRSHPNAIGPRKRPMHTIIPAMAFRDGRCELSFGVMGSHFQPMGHTHFLVNTIDYGMDVQEAIDFPRAFFEGERTILERGIPASTIDGLGARGHQIEVPVPPLGGAQAIRIDWERGTLTGGSDPRKDGTALGF
jgi:gamma-glutamyltranspeptidase / glutathione hydrolase